jgi:hypothetical protein
MRSLVDRGFLGIATDAAVETGLPGAHLDEIAAMMHGPAITFEGLQARSVLET